jgi:BirA family transcriptional regulator, biotin operon repressor / biotin---[acetyl-CoA-carboxylase] ligase
MDTHYASVVLSTAESTQDEAAARFGGDPVLVVAEHQTRGRGRLDRAWMEPDRALFASLAFVPAWPVATWGLIPLVAALAMREAVADRVGVDVELKWPNDLIAGSGKVGGILVEASASRVVVGCGLNLWWVDPIPGAAALLDDDPGSVLATEIAAVWVQRFLERMAADPALWGRHEYEAACTTMGQAVAFERASGIATGIEADGSLLVDTGEGVVAVYGGADHATTLPSPPAAGGGATEEPA